MILVTLLVPAGGCKEEEVPVAGELGEPCSADEPCVAGLVCDPLDGGTGEYVCAGPLEVRGQVIDALDQSPVAGARVIAMDAGGAPISDVAITDAEGRYAMVVAVPRDAEGNPAAVQALTMQASAADYQLYPSALQPAFPVSTADAAEVEDNPDDDLDDELSVIENASTTIALLPLADAGGFTVSGRVAADDPGGTLVVSEAGTGRYGIADREGEFTIFNVPAGATTIAGYRGGLQLVPEPIDVSADVSGVVLEPAAEGPGVVSGSVNIVNAPGGSATSVVLIPSGLFIEALEFGPVPYGLRAPEPGVAPNVGGAWTISGVPAGTYKVIASLENDDLVRDPDTSIAGTQILEITVAPGETVDLQDSFKITGALAVVSPGAEGPEEVGGTPVFVFADDSSEDGYEVVVHDALGNELWRDDAIPAVMGNQNVEVEYGGPPLTEGMYYRFRATSIKDGVPISRTEDLRGVFVYRGG